MRVLYFTEYICDKQSRLLTHVLKKNTKFILCVWAQIKLVSYKCLKKKAAETNIPQFNDSLSFNLPWTRSSDSFDINKTLVFLLIEPDLWVNRLLLIYVFFEFLVSPFQGSFLPPLLQNFLFCYCLFCTTHSSPSSQELKLNSMI
jgi:hypothetical protein